MGIQINGQTDTVTSTSAGGSVKVTPLAASTGLNVGTGASISSPATNVLTLGTNNTESVRLTSGGNVGINSTIPKSKLDVGGTIFAGRNDSSSEGGEIAFCKSLDNSSAWSVDVYGSTSTPSLRFIDNTAGASRKEIDGSGRVTMPYQPSFSVWLNGNQDIAHNTLTKVRFNAEVFDVGGNFDSSTNYRFTAPVAGKYLFMGHLYIYSTYQVEIFTYKNGSGYKRFSGPLGSGGNDNPNGLDFLDIIDLAVNDYVEIYGYQLRTGDSATVSIYGGGVKESSFVGYLIG